MNQGRAKVQFSLSLSVYPKQLYRLQLLLQRLILYTLFVMLSATMCVILPFCAVHLSYSVLLRQEQHFASYLFSLGQTGDGHNTILHFAARLSEQLPQRLHHRESALRFLRNILDYLITLDCFALTRKSPFLQHRGHRIA